MVSHPLFLTDNGTDLIEVLFLMPMIELAPIEGAMAKLVGLSDGAHDETMLASSSLLLMELLLVLLEFRLGSKPLFMDLLFVLVI